jgi:hypothetical protein
MRSEIMGSSGERPTVKEAVGGFSVFLASRISHSILRISSIKLRVATCVFNCFEEVASAWGPLKSKKRNIFSSVF